jgi:putative hydrolase of the HAD superfamily
VEGRTIRAVFFDAAGTLFHVKGSVAEVYLRYAEKYGVARTGELLEAVNEAFKRAFRDAPPPVFAVSDPIEIKRCERLWWFDIVHSVFYRVGMFERFDDFFDEVFEAFAGPEHWMLYPETLDVLKGLKESGLEVGIVSNFDTRLFGILRGLGIADLIATVTIPSLAHAAKPAARIFRVALEQHVLDPDEAIHVGNDLKEDLEGARAAGLTGVLLDRHREHVGLPDPTIQRLDELPGLIAAL